MSEELIVLLDDNGQPTGVAEKLSSHHSKTPLHLAFSCYVFNDSGEILVTRRALTKKVCPGQWTNSVCGHPFPNETFSHAISRRLQFELGMEMGGLKVILPDYRYKTPPFNGIIENEICPVYAAQSTSRPNLNPAEVMAFKWMSWQEYARALEADKNNVFSWWSKDQLKQIKSDADIHKYGKIGEA